VKPHCRETVKMIIKKYKNRHHPENASKGSYQTIEGHIGNVPEKVKRFRN